MRLKTIFASVAAGAACLMAAGAVDAGTYVISYSGSGGNTANLTITTLNTLDTAGGYDITGVTGTVDGDNVTGLIANPTPPNPAISPSGAFIFDNVYFPTSNPVLDIDGALFSSSGTSEWNLWGNGPGSYSLYAWNAGGYTVESVGLLTVPEPASWALLLLGVAAVGAGLRTSRGKFGAAAA